MTQIIAKSFKELKDVQQSNNKNEKLFTQFYRPIVSNQELSSEKYSEIKKKFKTIKQLHNKQGKYEGVKKVLPEFQDLIIKTWNKNVIKQKLPKTELINF